MRKIKQSAVLKLLENMENVVKKLPEDVRIGRLFLVDDGQGIILESGIHEAAKALRKTVETVEWAGMDHWELLQIRAGALMIYQFTNLDKGR